jgi:hypothetical protein
MKIFVNKPLKYSKNLPEIIKSIKNTEKNHKNLYFDLGQNPMEIVHGPFQQNIFFLDANFGVLTFQRLFFEKILFKIFFSILSPETSDLAKIRYF